MIVLPLNLRSIVAVSVALALLFVFLILRDSKDKTEYNRVTGHITYLDRQLGRLPIRHIGKYRYLMLEGYQYPFEIFVGKEWGDFKPEFEQVDDLTVGETVTVFFYETEDTQTEGINRHIQFIDKGSKAIFVRGSSKKTLGGIMIGVCGLLAVGGVILWKKNKISF